MQKKLFITLIAVLAAALPALAADTYTIDKSHSETAFQIRHLVTPVRGRFNDFEGKIAYDKAKPEASSVEFRVKAESIDTSNADRDKHLRGADFFDVEKNPEITFKSTRVKPAGKDRFDVTGNFTMHGVTKEITLPVTFLGEAKDPWGNQRAGFETEATLDRKDYGIVWNKALDTGGALLGDDVKVVISLEAVKDKPAPAGK